MKQGIRRHLSILLVILVAVLLVIGLLVTVNVLSNNEDPRGTGRTASKSSESGAASVENDVNTEIAMRPQLSDDSVPQALKEFYAQKVEWKKCDDYVCGSVKVPLDYENPQKSQISIAVKMLPANSGKTVPKATLFLNPGGPGGSGVEIVETVKSFFPSSFTKEISLAGFDPRGVGESAPIKCISDEELDQVLADSRYQSSDVASRAESIAISKHIGEQCAKNSNGVLPYVDTVSAARDIDILRAVVGDKTLTYMGFSYGTYLGSIYASIFPQNSGRLVLDGAMDPSLNNLQTSIDQVKGFESAMRDFVAWCNKQKVCPLPENPDVALEKVSQFLDRLTDQPLPTEDPERNLTQALGVTGIIAPLYVQEAWPGILFGLVQAIENGDGSVLLNFADTLTGRKEDGSYDNSTVANWAINCLDFSVASDPTVWQQNDAELVKNSPFLGKYMTGGEILCSQWPVKPKSVRTALSVETDTPIVIVGTTGDPATPYAWAKSLHKQIRNSVLLTSQATQHTAFLVSGKCITEPILEYIAGGAVPEDGITCEN